MRLKCAGLTDVGMARDHNEDDFYLCPDEALCVVADGMGGHQSGEVASRMAIEEITKYYKETADPETPIELPYWPFRRKKPESREERRLIAAMTKANSAIHTAAGTSEQYRGMGTTIVGAFFFDTGLYIGHVGDSRAYRFRDGVLSQISEDHSLANEYIRMGILRAEDVENFPYKNVITRAVGLAETVEVETHLHELKDGDLYILCSDGLSDPIRDSEMQKILCEYHEDLEACCRELVTTANRNGGPDNVTVVLAKAVL